MREHPSVHDDPERTQKSGPPDLGADDPLRHRPPAALPPSAPADQTVVDGGPFARPRATSGDNASPGNAWAKDEPTIEPATKRVDQTPSPPSTQQPSRWAEIKEIAKDFLHKHERKIWWLHTAYALSLGAFVATFAQKDFEHARFLTLSLVGVWLLVVAFFRFFGTGAQQDFITAWPGARRRFFVMTYLMKNLFQGMLFFLLPIYYRSGSSDAKTIGVFYLLGACAILSTLDLVFDRVLLRFKFIASLFFGVTLFGVMNVAIPALFPNMPSLMTLLVAGGLAVTTFFLFHVSLVSLKRPLIAGTFVSCLFLGVLGFYFFRHAFPPVPMYIKAGGVGPSMSTDGTVAMELKTVKADAFADLYAVTDISVVGHGDDLVHVWKHERRLIPHAEMTSIGKPKDKNVVRVSSRLTETDRPSSLVGHWTVDVETKSGQIVGRINFEVRP